MYRIRDLREDSDLSQKAIASLLNITQQQYSKIELEMSDISGKNLRKLAEFYNVSVDYILGLIEKPRSLK